MQEIDPREAEQILVEMEADEASEIRTLLAYPSETAGGIMTPAFVSVGPDVRADQAIAGLRVVAEEAETLNYVYVLDEDDHCWACCRCTGLVLTRPETPIRELMFADVVSVPVHADQEVAARLLVDHNLLALPVVDDDNHLLGIITADDVADVLEQEATEDFERLGGSEPLDEPYLRASPFHLTRKRVGWLLALSSLRRTPARCSSTSRTTWKRSSR